MIVTGPRLEYYCVRADDTRAASSVYYGFLTGYVMKYLCTLVLNWGMTLYDSCQTVCFRYVLHWGSMK